MKTVLQINGEAVTLDAVERRLKEIAFTLNNKKYRFRGEMLPDGRFLLESEHGKREAGALWPDGKGARRVQLGAHEAVISQKASTSAEASVDRLAPLAPMPGLVQQVLVKAGDKVEKGQALVVLEAMKLQLSLAAGGDATVEAVLVKKGDMVSEGAELVSLKERG